MYVYLELYFMYVNFILCTLFYFMIELYFMYVYPVYIK